MVNRKVEKYIEDILEKHFGDKWNNIYTNSMLLKYLNLKSGAIHGNVKTRRSLANWYAIYAILNYYVEGGFVNNKDKYLKFGGFQYNKLFDFQRE